MVNSCYTLWGIRSVMVLCFVFLQKFQLPIGLHSSCSISPTPVEHVKKALQNITTERTPKSVYGQKEVFDMGLHIVLAFNCLSLPLRLVLKPNAVSLSVHPKRFLALILTSYSVSGRSFSKT